MTTTDDKSYYIAKAKLAEYLDNRHMRKTPERFMILEVVMAHNDHFGVDDIYEDLEESSLVRKHQFGTNKQSLYEKVISTGNHHHLICTECGKIKEVKDLELIHLIGDRKYGSFSVSYISLYVYGVCATCRRKKRKSKTTK